MKRTILKSILCISCWAALLSAQSNTGTIMGVVEDSGGAVIPGVTVSITHVQTNQARSAVTNHVGYYEAPLLPIGEYRLSVTHPGFKNLVRAGITLVQGQHAKVDIRLEVGNVQQSISVTADAPIVNSASPELGVTFGARQIADLPLNGRSFSAFLLLEPGVQQSVFGGQREVYAFNGGFVNGATFTLDGTDASFIETPSTGGIQINFTPLVNTIGIDNIEEIKTTTATFSAESGRASAGGVNVITKSGTNDFRGTIFDFFRNDAMNARNFLLSPSARKPPVKVNQFGGNFSGPVIHDKIFFLFGYEGGRLRRTQVVNATVPSKSFRDRVPSVLQPLLEDVPLPTSGGAGTANTGIFQFVIPPKQREDHGTFKFDLQPTPVDRLFLRYNINDGYNAVPRNLPFNIYYVAQTQHVATVSHSRILGKFMQNELRLGFNRIAAIQRLTGGAGGNPDLNIQISGVFSTTGGGTGTNYGNNSYTLADNLQRQAGRHSLKTGFEIRYLQGARVDRDPKYTVVYNTPDDFFANRIYNVIITFGNDGRGLRQTNYGFYFQDDFKVNPRLTLNLGLRYEYYTVFKEHYGRLYNVVSAPDGPWRPEGAPAYSPDRNNWEPRVGFAWMPLAGQRTVVRGGMGLYHAPLPLWYLTYNIQSPSRPLRSDLLGTDVPGGLSYPLPSNVDQVAIAQPVLSRYAFDPNIRDNYSVQWSLNVQHQILKSTALMIGYVGNRGLKIPQTRQLNLYVPELGRRSNATLGTINYYKGADMSVYHGLQTTLRRRLSQGLTFEAHYTYSKTLLNGCSKPTDNVQNFDNLRADRAVSNINFTHVLTSNFSYDLPFGSGRHFLSALPSVPRRFIEGWQITGIVGYRSGAPLNVISGQDVRGNGAGAQRPNLVPGVSIIPDNRSMSTYFSRAAFVLPPKGQFGSLGRNVLRGPSVPRYDLSLFKNISLTEKKKLQFRTEFFSFFNHPIWANPTVSIASSNFGRITSGSGNREIQLGLKLMF